MTAQTTRTPAQLPSSSPSTPVDEAPARADVQQPAHVRLAGLDGVRGIAVLAVMAYHFALFAELPASATWLDSTVATITNTGWVGVDLFFVLSGFLITGILYDAAAAPTGYFRAFYARRALRILPVYFGFLAVLLWLLPAVHSMQSADFRELRSNQLWFWGFSANIWMAGREWWQANLYGTGHLWSLAIEEQFYIVWPAVVLLSRRRGLMAIAAIAIVVPFALRIVLWQVDARPYTIYVLTPARLDGLAVGAMIALCVRDPRARARLLHWRAPLALAALAILIALLATQGEIDPYNRWMQYAGLSALAVLFGTVIATVATGSTGALRAVTHTRFLRATGRYSYALYVFHVPIATWLAWNTDIASWPPTVLGSYLPGRLLFSGVACIITFAAAIASWHLYESQLLKLKDRVPYGAQRAARADAEPVAPPAR